LKNNRSRQPSRKQKPELPSRSPANKRREAPPSPTPYSIFKEGKELPILLETPRFLILDKPAGLAVHPGPQTEDSAESRLTPHPRGGPWLAHRLDADTSGCLLIARRKSALLEAQKAFQERRVNKLYWAVVKGNLTEDSGEITTSLMRQSDKKGWKMIAAKKGDPAHTRWRVLGRADGLCWLELELLTGRTHQARIHCASIGAPILGDPIYGQRDPRGLHLLAHSLNVTLSDEETLSAEANPAPHMAQTLRRLGWRGKTSAHGGEKDNG